MENPNQTPDIPANSSAAQPRHKEQRDSEKTTDPAARAPKVKATFRVTVPEETARMSRPVCIAGVLHQGRRGQADWDAGAYPMQQGKDGTWSITLSFPPGAQVEYKYCLGDWLYVEQDEHCRDTLNRRFVAPEQPTETRAILDHVVCWRSVDPCGA